MTLTFQPVKVATVSRENGLLVFADNYLVAILVQLAEEQGKLDGQWYVEATFGRALDIDGSQVTFSDLAEAEVWMRHRLTAKAV